MTARPDPDELLARTRAETAAEKRGKLTIFFGAAPGVGKTYAMLEAARAEARDRVDVVIGVVETHGRAETATLAEGIEEVSRQRVVHRGIDLHELDLDAAIARRPRLLLVDELAHTNATGMRHKKRWQDVEELLAAGIDVFTTLNVQHLESLKDVVAQVTGVVVRESVPDSVFENAYEVRVVDLPVDELRSRLREGKVYPEEQAARAAEGFFREGNLIALRELSLRRTAERVESKMRSYKAAHGIAPTWPTGERVLVCVSPSPSSERLVRAARRMAARLHAELLGVYVETPASIRLSADNRERLAHNMRLVESLGGEAVVLRAEDASRETVAYARKRNVTKIVLGKPTHPRWRDVVFPSFLDEVVRRSREIDVYVISGDPEGANGTPARRSDRRRIPPLHFAKTIALVGLATTLSWVLFQRTELADVVMIHLLAVVIIAMRYGYVASIVGTLLGILAVDVIFVPPYFSLAVSDLRHVATFAVMFVVAIVTSHLTRRVRDQADSARAREARTASLFATARELGAARSAEELATIAARQVEQSFDCDVVLYLRTAGSIRRAHGADVEAGEKTRTAIDWALRHGKAAGLATDTLPTARAFALPLRGSKGTIGILTLAPTEELEATFVRRLRDPDERQLLDTIAGLVGGALERYGLEDEAREARVAAEKEHLRNALLSSVSHDLRTPLGVVTGATSALLDEGADLDSMSRRELLQTAHDEAERLSRLVRNLLDMTRLEAGAIAPKARIESVEEIVGSVLGRVGGRVLTTAIPSDLVVACDSALLGQVLINLVENAVKYSPADTPIHVAARDAGATVEIEVADRGPGISAAEKARVFEKFYRAKEAEGGGVGLGLTVSRGIVDAHGGRIDVLDRDGGGSIFRVSLPSPRTHDDG